MFDVLAVVLLPFVGTAAGAACVFFMRREMHRIFQHGLLGFAAGVMTAASIWSLILPAAAQARSMGQSALGPIGAGGGLGVIFLLLIKRALAGLRKGKNPSGAADGRVSGISVLTLAIILHNIPEGMAVGAACAGWLAGTGAEGIAGALALAAGIAAQNFPEGAVVSMPLHSGGISAKRAFGWGVFSGAVEPAGAALMICLAGIFTPLLPYFLGFAAGAMLYVAAGDIIPELFASGGFRSGMAFFAAGFVLMMVLDVVLG